jgi:two-component system, response regulator
MEQAIELLLVEDNPSDVELTLHVLKKNNFANRIKVVRDGAEALDFIFDDAVSHAGNVPKLILLDLKLPKVNGLEVLGRIKADARTKKIPVVVLTSSREDRDLLACYQLGVNSYLVKPVDFVHFTEAVRQLGLYWLLLNQQPQTLMAATEA